MLCRDIEMACDEEVIKNMSFGDKKEYSGVLLSCASQRRLVSVCPLAFGEVGVKRRVKSVLNYKKPAFWITIPAIIICIIVAICFLTDPQKEYSLGTAISPEEENNVYVRDESVNEYPEPEPVLDINDYAMEMERVISSIGLENAYPWNNTVELQRNADAIIKMAGDDTGRFEIYGIMSAKYGTCGLLLNDWIDGEQNWNFEFVPWYYSGAPSDQPILEPDGNGKYIFAYVYQYEDDAPIWNECSPV